MCGFYARTGIQAGESDVSQVSVLSDRVRNKRVGSVTNVELRKSDDKRYYNDTQSESPYMNAG
jgi:hypothetical protein